MKSVVYVGAENVEFREIPKVESKEGWTRIKVSHAGICGSDLNIYFGTHPRAKAPLVMGHEFSGYVDEDNSVYPKGTLVTVNPLLSCGECEPCKSGQSHVCNTLKLLGIDCDGGFAEYALVPNDKMIALPEGVSGKMGAFIEPVAVAVHALREGGYNPGDNAVVFGAGTIGLNVAMTLKCFGATDVTVVETNEFRCNMAKELGFKVINPIKENAVEEIKKATNGNGADFVVDCAGNQAVANCLIDAVKVRGTVLIVAGYKKPAELPLIQGMFKEISIKFVRVYTHKDFAIAAEMVGKDKNFERLITHVLAPEDAKKGFELLTTGADAIKVLYKFD